MGEQETFFLRHICFVFLHSSAVSNEANLFVATMRQEGGGATPRGLAVTRRRTAGIPHPRPRPQSLFLPHPTPTLRGAGRGRGSAGRAGTVRNTVREPVRAAALRSNHISFFCYCTAVAIAIALEYRTEPRRTRTRSNQPHFRYDYRHKIGNFLFLCCKLVRLIKSGIFQSHFKDVKSET